MQAGVTASGVATWWMLCEARVYCHFVFPSFTGGVTTGLSGNLAKRAVLVGGGRGVVRRYPWNCAIHGTTLCRWPRQCSLTPKLTPLSPITTGFAPSSRPLSGLPERAGTRRQRARNGGLPTWQATYAAS